MRDAWFGLVDSLLRPARARIEPCRSEATRLVEHWAARRARALADCEARIEAARAEVFAAKDGVVTARMTGLEREWRRISRGDRDGELMELWARIAPTAWLDRKRWRDAPPSAQLEAATLLAADPDGVERAEAVVAAEGKRVRWRPLAGDFEGMPALVGGSLVDARVLDAVLARFPDRPHLARAVALAARADARRYFDLWRAGYVVGGFDDASVTLELPPHE